MLAIRLQRNGRKAFPLYRIVVQEAQRHPLSGRIVAQVGSYNPQYLNNGAQPSTRVIRILTKEGIKMPKWVKIPLEKHSTAKHADKLRKNQPKEEAAPAEEAPAEA